MVLAAERERREANGAQAGILLAVTDWNVWHLGCIYCGLTIGLYGTGFWMPQIIRSLNPAFTNTEIGIAMMVPFLVALACMIGWGIHSDRTGERRWHLAIPPIIAGLALAGAGIVADPVVVFILLVIATAGIYSSFGPFWTWPSFFFTGAAASVGIAVINSVGNAGGIHRTDACQGPRPGHRGPRDGVLRNWGRPYPLRYPCGTGPETLQPGHGQVSKKPDEIRGTIPTRADYRLAAGSDFMISVFFNSD
jgi:hypothetical protein